MRLWLSAITLCCLTLCGCGTTRWTDSTRTATEQLLISDALDRAVSRIDFRAVAGKKVFLDTLPITSTTDSAYLCSLLRQHMLAAGCLLQPAKEQADYVVEVRAGAVGTDRRDVLFGVPAAKLGGVVNMPGVPDAVPEIPLAKNTEQRAVAKIAVFAYNRQTGRPIWQSGVIPVESKAKDIWFFGAGPFQRGSIYDGTKFAGSKIKLPLVPDEKQGHRRVVAVTEEAYFTEPTDDKPKQEQVAKTDTKKTETAPNEKDKAGPKKDGPAASGGVVQAGHTAAIPTSPAVTSPPASPPPSAAPSAPSPQAGAAPPAAPSPQASAAPPAAAAGTAAAAPPPSPPPKPAPPPAPSPPAIATPAQPPATATSGPPGHLGPSSDSKPALELPPLPLPLLLKS